MHELLSIEVYLVLSFDTFRVRARSGKYEGLSATVAMSPYISEQIDLMGSSPGESTACQKVFLYNLVSDQFR